MAVVARKSAVPLSDWRSYVTLSGSIDGVNDTFTTPEAFRNTADIGIHLYVNGQRYEEGEDFTVSESGGPGTGFDTVVFAPECVPRAGDKVKADYLAT